MGRLLNDWILSYMEYTEGTEAPRLMHFWVAVSTIAGALKRRVWLDMKRFKWHANFFIILVAKPGIISKTTTMDIGMSLLKKVPGVKFGPDIVTWPALVQTFAEAGEMFQWGEDFYPMSALTLASGELGNLLDPRDKQMVNLFIDLWDGRLSFEKVTKMSGSDSINAPWINMLGCTTPHWIADNMPEAAIGGGLVSRCIFVYGDRKETFVAYPDEKARTDNESRAANLIADLEHMSVNMVGPFTLLPEAREWGREWYETLWTTGYKNLKDERLEGYIARKQTHMHKLAMILSASAGDSMEISLNNLQLANQMLNEVEVDFEKVFSQIGRSDASIQAERLLNYIRKVGRVPYQQAYQHVHSAFPDFREFEGVLSGLIRSGQVGLDLAGIGGDLAKAWLVFLPAKNK